MEHSAPPSNWSTASAKLAATYGGLGFIVWTRETEIMEKNARINLRFFISDTTVQGPYKLDRDGLREAWGSGALLRDDPMHPFLQGMRACFNIAALLKWQATGARYRLQEIVPGQAWQYAAGEEDPRLTLCAQKCRTTDLPLAAALGVIGIPVIDSDGAPPRRGYILPAFGHRALQFGLAVPADPTETVTCLKRIAPGKPDLQLEIDFPAHPLLPAYAAAYAYGKIEADIARRNRERNVLIKDPYSSRRALMPENPSQAMKSAVRNFFRVP